ncbi:MAG: hypothetical protein WAT39_04100, partial [Planctomycetota bacterium]
MSARLAAAAIERGIHADCRTEAIACFHRTGEPDAWTRTAGSAPGDWSPGELDPASIELREPAAAWFRQPFLPNQAPRGYFVCMTQPTPDGLPLRPGEEAGVGMFVQAAARWRLVGHAPEPCRLHFANLDTLGYTFAGAAEVHGDFEIELPDPPVFGPYGRLTSVRCAAGRVWLTRCRVDAGLPRQQVLVSAVHRTQFITIADSGTRIAVSTGWYHDRMPDPVALLAALQWRRDRLGLATEALGGSPSLGEPVVAGLLHALADRRSELANAARRNEDNAANLAGERARCTALDAQVDQLRAQVVQLRAEYESARADCDRVRAQCDALLEQAARDRGMRAAHLALLDAAAKLQQRAAALGTELHEIRNALAAGFVARSVQAVRRAVQRGAGPSNVLHAVVLVGAARIDARIARHAAAWAAGGWRVTVLVVPGVASAAARGDMPGVQVTDTDPATVRPLRGERRLLA